MCQSPPVTCREQLDVALPSLCRCPNSVHYWQHNPCQRRILILDEARYIQIELKSCSIGPEPRLHDPEGGGLVDLGSWLQTLAHPQSARADVGVRKTQKREKQKKLQLCQKVRRAAVPRRQADRGGPAVHRLRTLPQEELFA